MADAGLAGEGLLGFKVCCQRLLLNQTREGRDLLSLYRMRLLPPALRRLLWDSMLDATSRGLADYPLDEYVSRLARQIPEVQVLRESEKDLVCRAVSAYYLKNDVPFRTSDGLVAYLVFLVHRDSLPTSALKSLELLGLLDRVYFPIRPTLDPDLRSPADKLLKVCAVVDQDLVGWLQGW